MVTLLGLVVLATGIALLVTRTVSGAVALPIIVLGGVALLVTLFRRFGRPGDFNRSGWSG